MAQRALRLRHRGDDAWQADRQLAGQVAPPRVAEENIRSLFVLTMVTVLALPTNLTSGLMGMNVGGVPWDQDPHGFWWMVLLIAGGSALACGFGLWRRRGDEHRGGVHGG